MVGQPSRPPVAFLQLALLDIVFFHSWREALVAGVKGEGAKPPPPPHSPRTDGGTTALPRCGGGMARPKKCSPTPASDLGAPSPLVSLLPSRGYALELCAWGTSSLGLKGAPGRGTLAGSSLVALHPLVPCLGGVWVGSELLAASPAGPDMALLGPDCPVLGVAGGGFSIGGRGPQF